MVPGQVALLRVVGKGLGGLGTGSQQGRLVRGPGRQEMKLGVQEEGLGLTFPVWLAESWP